MNNGSEIAMQKTEISGGSDELMNALKQSFREYLSVSEHIEAGGQAMDSIAADLTRIVLAAAPTQQGLDAAAALREARKAVMQVRREILNHQRSADLECPSHTAGQLVGVDMARAAIARIESELPTQQGLDAREFPAMTPELASILGLMCFQCIPFAQALRASGQQIKHRAEDEQAAVLHWMLGHYFKHGQTWRDAAAKDMERMQADAIAAQAKQGEQAYG